MTDLKALTPRRLKLALIALPLALAGLYYAMVAADRYVSESTVALQRTGNDMSSVPGAALLLAGITPPAREDVLYLLQYIRSLDLLTRLDARLGLRKHYESGGPDIVSRLPADASQEDFLDYYRKRVDVSMDELSSTLTIRVQAFDARFANEVNRAILDESERFVNEMSYKLAREKLAFAETELARAGDRLQQAKTEVLTFQAKNKFLDPSVQAQASGMMTAELQAAITRAETELRNMRSYLNDDAYQVRAMQAQIASLRAQLDTERDRATSADKRSDRLGALAIEFRGLQLKGEFALDAYKLALGAVENARIDTLRKIKNLVVIQTATLPQTAEYPRRLYNLATLLIVCLLIYGVIRLVIATIREHQD